MHSKIERLLCIVPPLVRRLSAFCIIPIAALVVASCAFGDDKDIVVLRGAEEQYLYVVGRSNNLATLWSVGARGTVKVPLQGSTGTTASEAMSCRIADGRLYVSGWIQVGGIGHPCIWMNGVFMMLDAQGSTNVPNGTAIDVKNGHVAVAGQAGIMGHACYWLDGALCMLPEPSNANTNSQATSIKFDDLGLVVGGICSNGPNKQACFWIDNQY